MQPLRHPVRLLQDPQDVAPHRLLQPSLPGFLLQICQLFAHRDVLLINVQDEVSRQSAGADGRQVFSRDDRHAPGRCVRLDGAVRVQPAPVHAVAEGPAQGLRSRGHLPLFLHAGYRVVVIYQDRHILHQERFLPDLVARVVKAGRRVLRVEVAEVAHGQRRRRGLVCSALAVQEKREGRHDVRLAHPFPQRRQVDRPQQRDADLFLHHVLDFKALLCRVRQGDLVEAPGPAAVQPVVLQRVAHVHRDPVHPHGPAVVQVAPFPADLPPSGVVIFRHPLRGHLAHLFDRPGHLALGGASRGQAGVKAPLFRHPVHALQLAGLHHHTRQFPSAAAPSVQHKVLAHVHAVVLFQLHPGQHHKVAQGLRLVAGFLADRPVRHPVALHRAVQLLRLFLGRQPEGHRLRVKVLRGGHLPGQGVHRVHVAHDLHHVADVALLRQLRAGFLDVHQADPLRDPPQLQRHVVGVVLSGVVVALAVVVRQDDHVCPRQPPAVSFPPLSGPARVARGAVAQPLQGFHVLLALDHEHRLAFRDRFDHVRQPVQGHVPDLRRYRVHVALLVRLRVLRIVHPLPEGLPGLPVLVVQPHHLEQLLPVLVRVAVHPVRVLPVRDERVLLVLHRFHRLVNHQPAGRLAVT